MGLKIITYKGYDFAIQAYSEDDFANISELNGDSFQIDFVNNIIETSGKETTDWKKKKNEFVISELKIIIDNHFLNFKIQ